MTASVTTAPAIPQARPITPLVAVGDIAAIAKRNLLRVARTPQLLVFSTIQPVMFVLLFRYVFGGAIQTPGSTYVDFLMAGIFVQTTLFGGAQTAVGLAEDLRGGIVDRFRSLPMARSAVLAGRTFADLARNVLVLLLMVIVATGVGFRFHDGVIRSFVAVVLDMSFVFALLCVCVFIM